MRCLQVPGGLSPALDPEDPANGHLVFDSDLWPQQAPAFATAAKPALAAHSRPLMQQLAAMPTAMQQLSALPPQPTEVLPAHQAVAEQQPCQLIAALQSTRQQLAQWRVTAERQFFAHQQVIQEIRLALPQLTTMQTMMKCLPAQQHDALQQSQQQQVQDVLHLPPLQQQQVPEAPQQTAGVTAVAVAAASGAPAAACGAADATSGAAAVSGAERRTTAMHIELQQAQVPEVSDGPSAAALHNGQQQQQQQCGSPRSPSRYGPPGRFGCHLLDSRSGTEDERQEDDAMLRPTDAMLQLANHHDAILQTADAMLQVSVIGNMCVICGCWAPVFIAMSRSVVPTRRQICRRYAIADLLCSIPTTAGQIHRAALWHHI